MGSRHLIVKLYLWLLLALTLSAAGGAGVFALLSPQSFEERAQAFMRDELGSVRDLTERLLHSGLPVDTVRGMLADLAAPHRGELLVTDAAGTPVIDIGPHADGGDARLSPAERDTVLRDGAFVDWRGHGRTVVALPISLPDGERGLFSVTFQRFRWEGHGAPWRLLAGLAAMLAVLWLLSWPLAAHLARPLQRMSRVADALGQGDLSARIAPRDVQRRHRRRLRRDEIGRLARSFNAMAENLERLVLGHKRLLGDISHELRSPLARLRLALELARGAEGEEQERYLETLERQADAMDALIAELLLYARLDETPHALRPEPLDAAALVEAAIAEQRPEAEAKGVAVRSRVAPNVPSLHAERRLLERALGNVLRNAIAYSPAGGQVDVAVTREAERVAITVTDSGPGVAPELRERIFEPFVREDAARSRSTGGVGLGLAIVRRCMEAHGGGASAAAGPGGRGLAITLWLPLTPRE